MNIDREPGSRCAGEVVDGCGSGTYTLYMVATKRRGTRKTKTTKASAKPRAKVSSAKATPEAKVLSLFAQGTKRVSWLLAAEKSRRGVAPDQLVFLGMHNVAQYMWCAMYSVLKSRANETMFFLAHLHDRITAALHLDRPLPPTLDRPTDLLTVGSDVAWTELPLQQPARDFLMVSGNVRGDKMWDVAVDGKPPSDAMTRGEWSERRNAERLPSKRWSFEWGPFVLVGIPDGIGRDFVYEFKSTASEYMLFFQKPVGVAQADLYGFFFGKPRKRLDIHVEKEGRTDRAEGDVDRGNAERVLGRFAELVAGGKPWPPKPWKCNNCEFRRKCPLG